MHKTQIITRGLSLPVGATLLTMSSFEISELTGKQHKNVLADIRKMLKGIRKRSAEFSADVPDTYGRMQPGFLLPKRECLVLVSGYSVELRARIIDRWMELEEQARNPVSAFALPDFANPAIAARAWAEQYEARILAERTKAQIGAKREATAMATASAAVREANKLRRELGQAFCEASVKRVEGVTGKSFGWRPLKSYSIANDLPLRKVPDTNYPEGVNVYQAEAWMAVYGVDLSELFPAAR